MQAGVSARLGALPAGLRDLARRASVFKYAFDAAELAVVDAPRLVRLILWVTAGDTGAMKIKIDRAPKLQCLVTWSQEFTNCRLATLSSMYLV